MANTRAEPPAEMGALPTFGDTAVPQAQDVNSYSDRQAAKEAAAPGEAQARVFGGLATQLGGMADSAAHYEGHKAGLVAGADPNYRPNADESIRGQAFNEAATQTYVNNLDASSKTQASAAYSQWLQLPPAQRTPDVLQKSFDKIAGDFKANHVFPEIEGAFNANFANQTTALMRDSISKYDEQVHNDAQASFLARDAANANAVDQIAATGREDNAGAVRSAVQQRLDNIDQARAAGALLPQKAFEAKQKAVDDAYVNFRASQLAQAPSSERAAIVEKWAKEPPGAPTPVWPAQPSANWAAKVNFGKAGPISVPTSANDPLAPEVKGGLEQLTKIVGPVTVTSTTGGQHDPNGFHPLGKAVDLSIAGMSDAQKTQLIEGARQAGFTGFGLGATHLHVDMRPSPDGKPVVFGDAYQGPVAGKTIGGWQTRLNGLGSPVAAGADVAGAPAVSFAAHQRLGVIADQLAKQADSQARQQETADLKEIADLHKGVMSGTPPKGYDDEIAAYKSSSSPAVAQKAYETDATKQSLDTFKGQRPEAILAQIDNMKGQFATNGGATQAQSNILDDLRKYYDGLKSDLATNALGRSAAEGTVGKLAALDPTSPTLRADIAARSVAMQHTADFYHQSSNFFLPGEGASFAQRLAAAPQGLAGVDAPTLNAMAEDEGFKKSLIGNSRSGDPARMKASFDAMNAIASASPMEFEGRFGKEAASGLNMWNSQIGFQPANEAAKQIMALNDPSQAVARKYRDEAADQQLKTVDENAVVKMFAQHWAMNPLTLVTGDTKPPLAPLDVPQSSAGGLRNDYVTAYKNYFALSGSASQASDSAFKEISQKWGVSAVNGGRLMPYPPEMAAKAYPAINGSHDWLAKQLDADIKKAVGDMGLDVTIDPEGSTVPGDLTKAQDSARTEYGGARALVSDAQTKADIDAGRAPSYRVIVQDGKGQFHVLEQSPGVVLRFVGDPAPEMAKQDDRFNAGLAREAEKRRQVDAVPPIGMP